MKKLIESLGDYFELPDPKPLKKNKEKNAFSISVCPYHDCLLLPLIFLIIKDSLKGIQLKFEITEWPEVPTVIRKDKYDVGYAAEEETRKKRNHYSVYHIKENLTTLTALILAEEYQAGKKDFFTKLHPNSDYVFHFQGNPEALNTLIQLSNDPVFPGYPYPLIYADKFARITNQEKEFLRTQFITKLGHDFNKLKKYINSTNAHDILDNIS